jgi:ATP-binding protein involved in chromosome partitioning
MPPGTGDAQLSLAQLVPLSGTVLVTTPQAVSTFDVGKAIGMFRQVNVDILGIVENMSGLTISGRVEGASGGRVLLNAGLREEQLELAEDGSFSTVVDVFGTGGAELLANKHGFPLLGRVPLDPAVRVAGDGGDPVVIAAPESAIALSFKEIAGLVARRLSIREHAQLPVLQ